MSVAGDAPADSLPRLRALLAERGGLLAGLLSGEDAPGAKATGEPSAAAALAAAGPRAEGRREEYELLLEAIYEGYLVHYGEPRLLRAPGNGPRAAGGRSAVRDRARTAGGDRRHATPSASSPTRSR